MAGNILEMDTLKTSIINAIKTLRSHKKRSDELTVLELVKKDLQISTITNNDINEILARLTEIGKIKNKPSNNRNSYCLIDDSTDVTDSQPPILAITNTPIVEKNVNLDNSLNSVPDQIDSFILVTLSLMQLISHTKICDFIQNEIRQK